MAELLDDGAIEQGLQDVSGWRREDDAIVRDLAFADFGAAMAFVNRVAEAAEAAGHHPDILVHGWNKVRLTVSNHSAGGITQADFDLAGRIDSLADG
jgi:4a-hydroxytetrahydrobiopterin dehydratase